MFFSYKANGAIHSLDHLGHTHALHAIMDWDIAHKSSHNDFFLDAFEDWVLGNFQGQCLFGGGPMFPWRQYLKFNLRGMVN